MLEEKREMLETLKSESNYLYHRMQSAKRNDHLIAMDEHQAKLEEVGEKIRELEK
jgi:hypothetical protein